MCSGPVELNAEARKELNGISNGKDKHSNGVVWEKGSGTTSKKKGSDGGNSMLVGLCKFIALYIFIVGSVGILTRLVCTTAGFSPSVEATEENALCVVTGKVLKGLLSPYCTLPNTQPTQSTSQLPSAETAQQHHKKHHAKAGPLKRTIDRAASFFRHKHNKPPRRSATQALDKQRIDGLWGPHAVSPPDAYSSQQQHDMATLSSRVIHSLQSQQSEQSTQDYNTRLKNVYWGSGAYNPNRSHVHPSFPWWFPNPAHGSHAKPSKYLQSVLPTLPIKADGSSLLAAYLKIMEWPMNLRSKFPYKICGGKQSCNAEFALSHTLEFREKYKPWCVSPRLMKENSIGWIYHRGYSHSISNNNNNEGEKQDVGGHAMIWYRPGLYRVQDPEFYTRNLIHALESAVAESLQRTHGTVGKYNLVLDCQHFSLSHMPRLQDVKRGMVMMQDHFPDRLGVLLLANLSGPAQFFLKLVTPFITESVRSKIHALPANDDAKRVEALRVLIDDDMIPYWLGGKDMYKFDYDEWYGDGVVKCTDEEALEYLTTMPYHA